MMKMPIIIGNDRDLQKIRSFFFNLYENIYQLFDYE